MDLLAPQLIRLGLSKLLSITRSYLSRNHACLIGRCINSWNDWPRSCSRSLSHSAYRGVKATNSIACADLRLQISDMIRIMSCLNSPRRGIQPLQTPWQSHIRICLCVESAFALPMLQSVIGYYWQPVWVHGTKHDTPLMLLHKYQLVMIAEFGLAKYLKNLKIAQYSLNICLIEHPAWQVLHNPSSDWQSSWLREHQQRF